MVFTFIDWEGGPFMRYALGDLLQLWTEPCPCGMPGMRFKIVGRTDDMLIVKGVNIYPEAIRKLLLEFAPRLTGHFRIRLSKPGPAVEPPLRLRIEAVQQDLEILEKELMGRFRSELRVAPAIEWLAPGTLPREAHKTKYIEIEGK
jgi:phenylacetate-CoA ligase